MSADSFRFNIQKCSRSLNAFIAFGPTCFVRRLVMRNLPETSTQRASNFIPILKITRDELPMEQGVYGGCPLRPLYPLIIRWIVIYPVDSAIQRWIKCIVTKKPEKPTDLPKIQYGRRLVDSAWTAQVSYMLL